MTNAPTISSQSFSSARPMPQTEIWTILELTRGLRSESEAKPSSVIRISPRLCRGPCRITCNAPNTVSHLLVTINRMQSSRIMIALDDNPTTQTSFSVL